LPACLCFRPRALSLFVPQVLFAVRCAFCLGCTIQPSLNHECADGADGGGGAGLRAGSAVRGTGWSGGEEGGEGGQGGAGAAGGGGGSAGGARRGGGGGGGGEGGEGGEGEQGFCTAPTVSALLLLLGGLALCCKAVWACLQRRRRANGRRFAKLAVRSN
jgi:hypothetical protein